MADEKNSDSSDLEIVSEKIPRRTNTARQSEVHVKKEVISPSSSPQHSNANVRVKNEPLNVEENNPDEGGGEDNSHIEIESDRSKSRSKSASSDDDRSHSARRRSHANEHFHQNRGRPLISARGGYRPPFASRGGFKNFRGHRGGDTSFRPRFPYSRFYDISPERSAENSKVSECRHNPKYRCRKCRSRSPESHSATKDSHGKQSGKRPSPLIKAEVPWRNSSPPIRKARSKTRSISSDSSDSSDSRSSKSGSRSRSPKSKRKRRDSSKRHEKRKKKKKHRHHSKEKRHSRSRSKTASLSSDESQHDSAENLDVSWILRTPSPNEREDDVQHSPAVPIVPTTNIRPHEEGDIDTLKKPTQIGQKKHVLDESMWLPTFKDPAETAQSSQADGEETPPPPPPPPRDQHSSISNTQEDYFAPETPLERAQLASNRIVQRLHQRKIDLAKRLEKEKVEEELRDRLVNISDDEGEEKGSTEVEERKFDPNSAQSGALPNLSQPPPPIIRMTLVNGKFIAVDGAGNPIPQLKHPPTAVNLNPALPPVSFFPGTPAAPSLIVPPVRFFQNVPPPGQRLPTGVVAATSVSSAMPPQSSGGGPFTLPPPTIPKLTFEGHQQTVPEGQSTHEVDPSEKILYESMVRHEKPLERIVAIPQLLEYMWSIGYYEIPAEESEELMFNKIVAKRRGLLGVNSLYQIVCYGHPELETYYCRMCHHWTTVSEIFLHLGSTMHRTNYMFRNYKMYHRRAMDEADEMFRDQLLKHFSQQIWKIEGSGKCTQRLRVVLNKTAMKRIWPDHENFVDHSWKLHCEDEDEEQGEEMGNSSSKHEETGDGRMEDDENADIDIRYASVQKPQDHDFRSFEEEGKSVAFQQQNPVEMVPPGYEGVPTTFEEFEARNAGEDGGELDPDRLEQAVRQWDQRVQKVKDQRQTPLIEAGDGGVPVRSSSRASSSAASGSMLSQNYRSTSRGAVSSTSTTLMNSSGLDETTERRKAVAAMVELQQEYDKNGGTLLPDVFFSICAEMGLSAEVVMRNRMLREAAGQYNVDLLPAFTRLQREQQQQQKQQRTSQPAPLQQQQPPPPSSNVPIPKLKAPLLSVNEMAEILKKVSAPGPSSTITAEPTMARAQNQFGMQQHPVPPQKTSSESWRKPLIGYEPALSLSDIISGSAASNATQNDDEPPMGELLEDFRDDFQMQQKSEKDDQRQKEITDEELGIRRPRRCPDLYENPEAIVKLDENLVPDSLVYPSFEEEEALEGEQRQRDPAEIESNINRLTFAFAPPKPKLPPPREPEQEEFFGDWPGGNARYPRDYDDYGPYDIDNEDFGRRPGERPPHWPPPRGFPRGGPPPPRRPPPPPGHPLYDEYYREWEDWGDDYPPPGHPRRRPPPPEFDHHRRYPPPPDPYWDEEWEEGAGPSRRPPPHGPRGMPPNPYPNLRDVPPNMRVAPPSPFVRKNWERDHGPPPSRLPPRNNRALEYDPSRYEWSSAQETLASSKANKYQKRKEFQELEQDAMAVGANVSYQFDTTAGPGTLPVVAEAATSSIGKGTNQLDFAADDFFVDKNDNKKENGSEKQPATSESIQKAPAGEGNEPKDRAEPIEKEQEKSSSAQVSMEKEADSCSRTDSEKTSADSSQQQSPFNIPPGLSKRQQKKLERALQHKQTPKPQLPPPRRDPTPPPPEPTSSKRKKKRNKNRDADEEEESGDLSGTGTGANTVPLGPNRRFFGGVDGEENPVGEEYEERGPPIPLNRVWAPPESGPPIPRIGDTPERFHPASRPPPMPLRSVRIDEDYGAREDEFYGAERRYPPGPWEDDYPPRDRTPLGGGGGQHHPVEPPPPRDRHFAARKEYEGGSQRHPSFGHHGNSVAPVARTTSSPPPPGYGDESTFDFHQDPFNQQQEQQFNSVLPLPPPPFSQQQMFWPPAAGIGGGVSSIPPPIPPEHGQFLPSSQPHQQFLHNLMASGIFGQQQSSGIPLPATSGPVPAPPPPPPPVPQPVPPPSMDDFPQPPPTTPSKSSSTVDLLFQPPPPPPPPPPAPAPQPKKPPPGSKFSSEHYNIIYGLDRQPLPPSAILRAASSSSASPMTPTTTTPTSGAPLPPTPASASTTSGTSDKNRGSIKRPSVPVTDPRRKPSSSASKK